MTPTARVLWAAGELAVGSVRSEAEVAGVADVALERELNPSQVAAVRGMASAALTVVWGPPGTGKTQTASAFIHGVVRLEARNAARPRYSILLTGPNYKAVNELASRVVQSLSSDERASCRIFFVAAATRAEDLSVPDGLPDHLEGADVTPDQDDPEFVRMADALETGTGVTIVACVIHQCPGLALRIARLRGEGDQALRRLFDLVLIDESSQVDMTTGVGPLALLKEQFQLIVAGDHLQMQPIMQIEPPVGAEYLVGSIQSYLTRRFRLQTQNLLENYRSHEDIVTYIKRLGYPAGMAAANPATALQWTADLTASCDAAQEDGALASDAWPLLLDERYPIVAMTYPDGMAGQANAFEADCVAALARSLFRGGSAALANRDDQPDHGPWTEEGFWATGLGVVTPHRAQRAQVIRSLSQVFSEVDLELIESAVDTVERFQGGQRHTIIISFGVGDPDVIAGEELFLLGLERTNVAISRAMAKCVVLLSEEMAAHLPDDPKAAAGAHALRGVVDEWCTHRTTTSVQTASGDRRVVTVRRRDL